MNNVVYLHTSMAAMVEKVMAEYPAAKKGIIVVFDGDGETMHTHWCCNDQHAALAGARLLHLAAGGGA